MKITKGKAREVVQLLWKVREDLARIADDFLPPNPDDPEVTAYRRSIARTMMSVFEDLAMPIYLKHPDLIPEGERVVVENELTRREHWKKQKPPKDAIKPEKGPGEDC